ncbi:MAG: ABC transporter substrate-binding protein [Opitutaceae bacterium]
MRARLALRAAGRVLALLFGSLVFVMAVFYAAAGLLRPKVGSEPTIFDPAEVGAAERARDVSIIHDELPVVTVDVDYAAGSAAPWYPRGEPSLLAPLVEQGRLPPVAERVGPEPLVMRGVDGPGTYGGTWFRVASSVADVSIINWRLAGATLVRWSPLGYPIRPHVARSYEISDDFREFTFHLRRGMRWSDGHPLTVDDILYSVEDDQILLGARPYWLEVGGTTGRVEKIDDLTVRYVFEKPNALFLETLCNQVNFALPRHYLEPFHPVLGDPELIERSMKALQLASPRALYGRMKDNFNPECPRLWPWVYRAHTPNPPFGFVRNPYFFAVDETGNQLPYLDRILFEVKPQNMIGLDASQGRLTFQTRNINYDDYTQLMSEREANGYDVLHWFSATRSSFTIFPNLNRRIDPDRPETGKKHTLLNTLAFRQALSLAINRADIIDSDFNGQTEPSQLAPGPESPFHHPDLMRSFIEYDPERANQLLDSLGLVERDGEGFRRFADGSRMVFFVYVTEYTGSGPAQLMIDDWAKVGLRVVLKDRARTLWQAEQTALEHDLTAWTGDGEYFPLLAPRNFVPIAVHSFYAPGFGVWQMQGGLWGDPAAARHPGAVEPPPGHPLRRAMEVLETARTTTGLAAQVEIYREILDIAAANLWTISVCTPPPQLAVASRHLHNVPRNVVFGSQFATPANGGIETWYLDNPGDTPETLDRMRETVMEPVLDPRMSLLTADSEDGSGRLLRWFLRILMFGMFAVVLALLILRHPFVGRRLIIMVPTLGVISIVVFVIIQLPRGDFLTARIQELEMMGDDGAVQSVKDLKTLFHTEEGMILRYARWLGLPWFLTWQPADKGLIQGDLGRSMENGRIVNDIVGDRILLTVGISFFTILFTWAIALPTGIYSAVRQYSIGDYILTFLGFIGMCVPGFLLALILIHLSSEWFGLKISGLFSAEFAGQVGWSWAKLTDLLKHIWVPVIVLGVGGTAGMIRVMRGNLLDELRKPYVTTARAKGVRPLRLLLKYPVRLALNPFISGIGAIFPQLVSGGAIVAMVLSLPTVGPLMLSALMAQDMYLAGSMLMVLSTLGVFGTLVSDLLLLMLDPRIRLEGGSR